MCEWGTVHSKSQTPAKQKYAGAEETQTLPAHRKDKTQIGSKGTKSHPDGEEYGVDGTTSESCEDIEFAPFEKPPGLNICAIIRNHTVIERQKTEQANSKRRGSNGQIVKRKYKNLKESSDYNRLNEQLSFETTEKDILSENEWELGNEHVL